MKKSKSTLTPQLLHSCVLMRSAGSACIAGASTAAPLQLRQELQKGFTAWSTQGTGHNMEGWVGGVTMMSMRAVSHSPRHLLFALRAESFSPGSKRPPPSCLLASDQHVHWPQVSFLQWANTLVRRVLAFEHTLLCFRSVTGAGLSVARAETLLQRESTASLIWEPHSAAHSPDIPELPHVVPEHKALQKPWLCSEEAARVEMADRSRVGGRGPLARLRWEPGEQAGGWERVRQ